ncbi:MAG: hypothetical protein K2J83_04075 [Clostridia bacterium]|nr:hypothetical protein [Clostridia bacterium]
MFSEFINNVYSKVASLSFDTLLWIIWGSFAGIFIATLLLSLCLPRIKTASKTPFFNLVNAYAALTFGAFITEEGLPQSVLAAVIFWCVGYLLYGLLCLTTKRKKQAAIQSQVAISSLPVTNPPVKQPVIRAEVPTAKSTVRLEHAISVTDRLLQKNLGKGDRQELEKLKNTLAVLQMKGALTPSESDILNENFNALLKLMAKYNV